MLITRKSRLSGVVHTMDIPCTPDQLNLYESGTVLIQNAMPDVPAELREFVISGITPNEWETMFSNLENDL
jgi:hypothetical protein